jgi:O-acetyl-ADP-ribose deacetylase (regulator of RNase III)
VAFPAISTGAFRFPAERAAGIALQTTVDMLPSAPALRRVIFCCFSRESARFHEQAMARV